MGVTKSVVSNKYWETETPIEIKGEKSVAKIYTENGKIQVFPVVPNSRFGIGKGATLDLSSMSVDQLEELRTEIGKAIDAQLVMD
jgi:hypothetical protein